jgi:hypothetical protein
LWTINDDYAYLILKDYVGADLSPYKIEGQFIVTDFVAPLKVRYIRDISGDVNTWDAMFRDVVALRLGQKLVPSLIKSDSAYARITSEYEKAIKDAKRVNAIELPSVPLPDDSFTIGRF